MNETHVINLNYSSPVKYLEDNASFYRNGEVNTKITLLLLKNMFSKNLSVISKLLESADDIEDIKYLNSTYDIIEIKMKSADVTQKLITDGVLRSEDEYEYETDYDDSSDEETNYQRLSEINRLTNTGNDSEDSSEDESMPENNIIVDYKNMTSLFDKFDSLY